MDTIKKYFNCSTVDENIELIAIDENERLHFNNEFSNESKNNENENIQSNIKTIDTSSPEDLNQHLIRKIQTLEEENDRLLSIIENKNVLIKESSKCNCNDASDVTAKKISQLTQKVQDLMSELQHIKSCTSGYNENSMEIKQLSEKLNLSNKKNCYFRDQIMRLNNELRVTRNALSNEIGDPTVVKEVLSSTGLSNFKGRAQQILKLQQRVNELQEKLNDSGNNAAHSSTVSLRKMEKERLIITDQTLRDTQCKVSELTRSLEFWKNRAKALDVEITALRVQKQKLITKSELDNKLIDNLKVELCNKNNFNNIQQLKNKDSELKSKESVNLLQSKYEQAQQIIEKQTSDLNDKDIKIADLESKISKHCEKLQNLNTCKVDFLDPKAFSLNKLDGIECKQLMKLLYVAHNQICDQFQIATDFKNKFLMEKHRTKTLEAKVEPKGSFTYSHKLRSNNILCDLQQELNPNEKLIELKNKSELAEEICATLQERLDSLSMINKENVQMFTRALNNIKQQFINYGRTKN